MARQPHGLRPAQPAADDVDRRRRPTSSTDVVDATGDAFVEVRADGVVVRVLSSSAFGYSPPQLLSRSLLTIVHPDEHSDLLQTLQALLMMASARAAAGAAAGSSSATPTPPATPHSLRVLHRVDLGIGGAQTPEPVAVDSIISLASSADARTPPQTLFVCSRSALPIAADPVRDAFSFRVVPTRMR